MATDFVNDILKKGSRATVDGDFVNTAVSKESEADQNKKSFSEAATSEQSDEESSKASEAKKYEGYGAHKKETINRVTDDLKDAESSFINEDFLKILDSQCNALEAEFSSMNLDNIANHEVRKVIASFKSSLNSNSLFLKSSIKGKVKTVETEERLKNISRDLYVISCAAVSNLPKGPLEFYNDCVKNKALAADNSDRAGFRMGVNSLTATLVGAEIAKAKSNEENLKENLKLFENRIGELTEFEDIRNSVNPVNGNNALHYAVVIGSDESMVEALIIQGKVDVNAMNKNGVTPLDFAVINGDERMAKILSDKGAKFKLLEKEQDQRDDGSRSSKKEKKANYKTENADKWSSKDNSKSEFGSGRDRAQEENLQKRMKDYLEKNKSSESKEENLVQKRQSQIEDQINAQATRIRAAIDDVQEYQEKLRKLKKGDKSAGVSLGFGAMVNDQGYLMDTKYDASHAATAEDSVAVAQGNISGNEKSYDAKDDASNVVITDKERELTQKDFLRQSIEDRLGIDLDKTDINSLLFHSVREGNFAMATLLIRAGADANSREAGTGKTALVVAIEYGRAPANLLSLLSVLSSEESRNSATKILEDKGGKSDLVEAIKRSGDKDNGAAILRDVLMIGDENEQRKDKVGSGKGQSISEDEMEKSKMIFEGLKKESIWVGKLLEADNVRQLLFGSEASGVAKEDKSLNPAEAAKTRRENQDPKPIKTPKATQRQQEESNAIQAPNVSQQQEAKPKIVEVQRVVQRQEVEPNATKTQRVTQQQEIEPKLAQSVKRQVAERQEELVRPKSVKTARAIREDKSLNPAEAAKTRRENQDPKPIKTPKATQRQQEESNAIQAPNVSQQQEAKPKIVEVQRVVQRQEVEPNATKTQRVTQQQEIEPKLAQSVKRQVAERQEELVRPKSVKTARAIREDKSLNPAEAAKTRRENQDPKPIKTPKATQRQQEESNAIQAPNVSQQQEAKPKIVEVQRVVQRQEVEPNATKTQRVTQQQEIEPKLAQSVKRQVAERQEELVRPKSVKTARAIREDKSLNPAEAAKTRRENQDPKPIKTPKATQRQQEESNAIQAPNVSQQQEAKPKIVEVQRVVQRQEVEPNATKTQRVTQQQEIEPKLAQSVKRQVAERQEELVRPKSVKTARAIREDKSLNPAEAAKTRRENQDPKPIKTPKATQRQQEESNATKTQIVTQQQEIEPKIAEAQRTIQQQEVELNATRTQGVTQQQEAESKILEVQRAAQPQEELIRPKPVEATRENKDLKPIKMQRATQHQQEKSIVIQTSKVAQQQEVKSKIIEVQRVAQQQEAEPKLTRSVKRQEAERQEELVRSKSAEVVKIARENQDPKPIEKQREVQQQEAKPNITEAPKVERRQEIKLKMAQRVNTHPVEVVKVPQQNLELRTTAKKPKKKVGEQSKIANQHPEQEQGRESREVVNQEIVDMCRDGRFEDKKRSRGDAFHGSEKREFGQEFDYEHMEEGGNKSASEISHDKDSGVSKPTEKGRKEDSSVGKSPSEIMSSTSLAGQEGLSK